MYRLVTASQVIYVFDSLRAVVVLQKRFITAEIFPMYAKDTAMALGVALNWVANWLIAFSFPHLAQVRP